MIEALKLRTFYMLCGMKETCTKAMREDATGHTCMIWSFSPLKTMHKVPVTVQEDAEDTKM